MEKKEMPTNFEILKMAREIAHNEYSDVRAQLHNKWLADSDIEWRTKGIKLPYPSFPPYPSEQEILKRAKKILDFLNGDYEITTTKKEETINVSPLLSSNTTLQEVEPISSETLLPSEELQLGSSVVNGEGEREGQRTNEGSGNGSNGLTETDHNVIRTTTLEASELLKKFPLVSGDSLDYAKMRAQKRASEYSSSTGKIVSNILNKIYR